MSGRRVAAGLLGVALVLATAGCASRADRSAMPSASCPRCLDPASPEVLAAYAAAIEAARYPAADKISRRLTPLLPSTDGLIWNDRGQILMVTWTKAQYFSDPESFRRGKAFALAVDTWWTAVPMVREFCRSFDHDDSMLTLRLEQLLGLPPGREKDAFVEIWVDPADLFRPCPDPEIFDHECLVEVPLVGRDPERRPWDCSIDKPQVAGRFVTVDPEHLLWMCTNWAVSYGNDEPLDNYPWTALGYTYDWGNPENPHGLSEYVSLKGSEVVFHSLTPTDVYCAKHF